MVPSCPAEALGRHAHTVCHLVVEAVRSRHVRFAEAHQVSGSRYTMGFGAQWRDLLVDVHEALKSRGYRTYQLPPAGYQLPVVNDCLVYVWRVPDSDAVTSFASSPTRVNGFSAPLLSPMLFEPGETDSSEKPIPSSEETKLEQIASAASDVMPLVLVIVQSTPRQLQSIEWAVAEFDAATGKVKLHGQERLWESEGVSANAATDIDSFSSGTPNGPEVEPREQEGERPDA